MNNLLPLKKNLLIVVLLDLTLLLLVLKLLMKVSIVRTMLGSFLGLNILNGDLSSLALDELIGNLKVHEVVMEKDSEIYRGKKERVKSISLKAKKESSDDETSTSGSDEEEYAMVVRQPREENKSFQKRDEKKGKSDLKCFRCGDPNHLIGDCPKPSRNKDQKAFIGGSCSDNENDAKDKTNDETCLMAQSSNEVTLNSSHYSNDASSLDNDTVMSSASSAVTYTSVYTDSEPGRPVSPPLPNYIPGPEEPQTTPEKQLPPIDSPTAESPGYVAESDPKEDPEEYEDDETEDGLVDYLVDGGDDGDDDDGDSSGEDADDEDEDEEKEGEEHLALADFTDVVPTIKPISPPEGTKPALDPAEAVPEIAPMTLREVNTRVIELAELHEHDTQDLYALLEDAQESRTCISQRVTIDSKRVDLLIEDRIAHQETVLIVEEEAYAS
ncbi:zf-CCHC domain-containing protein [Tanacetum coccineum]